MSVSLLVIVVVAVVAPSVQVDYDVELLPEQCDCRDWYGACRTNGNEWVDDGIWMYSCAGQNRSDARFDGCRTTAGKRIAVGANETIDALWHSCSAFVDRVQFAVEAHCRSTKGSLIHVGELFREGDFQWLCLSTGRWVKGCYFRDERGEDVLVAVGESRNNGAVRHLCSKQREYPALVQHISQVTPGVVSAEKGINRNLPEEAQLVIDESKIKTWLHGSAASFIAVDAEPLSAVRYLPPSRKPL